MTLKEKLKEIKRLADKIQEASEGSWLSRASGQYITSLQTTMTKQLDRLQAEFQDREADIKLETMTKVVETINKSAVDPFYDPLNSKPRKDSRADGERGETLANPAERLAEKA